MKRQVLAIVCLIGISTNVCASKEPTNENSEQKDQVIPGWQQEMASQIMAASQQISSALPLLPDDTPESIEETKQRIKQILVTQPTFFQAWLRLAELLEEFPLDTNADSFNVTQFRENIEQLLGYLEVIIQEELTEEERVALSEIESSTRFVLTDSPATSDSSGGDWIITAMNAAWKLVGAFAVLYIGYSVVDGAKQKKKLDDIAFKEKVDEIDQKWAAQIKDLRKKIRNLEKQEKENTDKAKNIVTKQEAEELIKEYRIRIKELEKATEETRRLRKAVQPKKPGLLSGLFGGSDHKDEVPKKMSKKEKRRSQRISKEEIDDSDDTDSEIEKEKPTKKKKKKKLKTSNR